jgi:hypothetical protein
LPLLEIIWESEVLRRLRKKTSDSTESATIWRNMPRCGICDRKMPASEDYGGDCVFCMAAAGDDVAIAHVERLVEVWKATEELLGRIVGLIHALEQRGEEDLAGEVQRALPLNTCVTDGWYLMLDGLRAARSSGDGRLTADERADLDEIIEAGEKGPVVY